MNFEEALWNPFVDIWFLDDDAEDPRDPRIQTHAESHVIGDLDYVEQDLPEWVHTGMGNTQTEEQTEQDRFENATKIEIE